MNGGATSSLVGSDDNDDAFWEGDGFFPLLLLSVRFMIDEEELLHDAKTTTMKMSCWCSLVGGRRRPRVWGLIVRENLEGIMFSLLYGLWKYLFSKAEFHVLILGIDKAGKTTVLEKLKTLFSDLEGLPPDRIVPTVGLNIGRVEAHKSKLIFWDLGGQLGLRTIWEKYFEEAHAVLYVVDAANQSRFDDAKSALEKVLRHPDLQGAPILIFANKQDLPAAVTAQDFSNYLDLKELNDRPSLVQAMSAYDGSGIQEGVFWLVEAMRKTKRTEELNRRADAAVTL